MQDFEQFLVPHLHHLATDRSWRIRHGLVSLIDEIANKMGLQRNQHILPLYAEFLADTEPEVRSVALKKLPHLVALFNSAAIISDLLPPMHELKTDPIVFVR